MPNNNKRLIAWMLPVWAAVGVLWYATDSTLISARDIAALADAAIVRAHVASLTGDAAPDMSLPLGITQTEFSGTNLLALDFRTLGAAAELAASIPLMTNPVWIASNDVAALDADSLTILESGYAPTETNWFDSGVQHVDYLPIARASGDAGIANLLFRPTVRTAADRFPSSGCPDSYFYVWGNRGTEIGGPLTNWSLPLAAWFHAGAWQALPRYKTPWPSGSYWSTNMGPSAFCTPAEAVVSNSIRRDLIPSEATLSAIRSALQGVKYTLYKLNSLSGTWVIEDAYSYGEDDSPSGASMPTDFSRWCIGESSTWYVATNSGTISYFSQTLADYHARLTNGIPWRNDGSSETMRLIHVRAELPYPCAWALGTGIVEQVSLYVVPRFTIYDWPGIVGIDTNAYATSFTHTPHLMREWGSLVSGSMSPPATAESFVEPAESESRRVSLSYLNDPSFFSRRAFRLWQSGESPTNAVADFSLSIGALPVIQDHFNFEQTITSKQDGSDETKKTSSLNARCEPDCWLILVRWADVLN